MYDCDRISDTRWSTQLTPPSLCSVMFGAVASPPILSVADKTAFVGDETRYLDGEFYASGSETHSCDGSRAD